MCIEVHKCAFDAVVISARHLRCDDFTPFVHGKRTQPVVPVGSGPDGLQERGGEEGGEGLG